MADETAKVSVIIDASGAKTGAADVAAAADKVVAAEDKIAAAATKSAKAVDEGEVKKAAARAKGAKSAEKAAADQAAADKRTEIANDRSIATLERYAKAWDPLLAKVSQAQRQFDTVADIFERTDNEKLKAQALSMVSEAFDRVTTAQKNMAAGFDVDKRTLELAAKFDKAGTSARAMGAELKDLNDALKLGINIDGGYANAHAKIVLAYNEGAQAALKQREAVMALREAQQMQTGQAIHADPRTILGLGAIGNARDSASVFEELIRKQDAINAARMAQAAQSGPDARTLLGLGGGAGSAAASAAVFEETAQAQAALASETQRLTALFRPATIAAEQYALGLKDIEAATTLLDLSTEEVAAAQAKLNASLQPATSNLRKHGDSAFAARFATQQLGVQTIQFFSALQAGQPFMMAFIGQAHQVVDVAISTGTGFKVLADGVRSFFSAIGRWVAANPIVTALVAATAAMAALGAMAEATARRMGDLRNALRGTQPDFEAMAGVAEKASKHLAATTRISTGDARAATQEIAAAPQFKGTQEQLEALVVAANDVAKSMGTTLPDAAKMFTAAMKDPAAAVEEMTDKRLVGFKAGMAEQARLLEQGGKKAEAFAIYLQGMRASFKGAADEMTPLEKAISDLGKVFTTAGQNGRSLAEVLGTPVIAAVTALINALTTVLNLAAKAVALAERAANLVPTPLANGLLNSIPGVAVVRGLNSLAGMGSSSSSIDATGIAEGLIGLRSNEIGGAMKMEVDAARTAWCAAFVNSALEQVGIKGTGSNLAASFAEWGVAASTAQRNDILVQLQNGQSHVGFATGQSRLGPAGQLQYEMVSGNYRNKVAQSWEDASSLSIRRAQAALYGPPVAPAAAAAAQASATGVANLDPEAEGRKLFRDTIPGQRQALQAEIDRWKRRREEIGANSEEGEKLTVTIGLMEGRLVNLRTATEQQTKSLQDATRVSGVEEGAAKRLADEYLRLDEAAIAQTGHVATLAQKEAARAEILKGLSKDMQLTIDTAQRQITANEDMAKAVEQGNGALLKRQALLKAEQEALTYGPRGSSQFNQARDLLYQKNIDIERSNQSIQAGTRSRTNQDTLAYLQAEIDTLGMNNDARTLYLSNLKAEQELKQQLPFLTQAETDKLLAQNQAIARSSLELQNYQKNISTFAGMFESAFDTISNSITQSLLSGQGAAINWRNIMLSVSQQVLSAFLKLALLNPVLNMLDPSGNRSTITSVFDALNRETPGSSSSSGGGGTGIFGTIFKLVAGIAGLVGGGGTPLSAAGSTAIAGLNGLAPTGGIGQLGAIYHAGGIVGANDNQVRLVDASIFANAPRFHGGLGGNEFAAILQRGERVLTDRQQQQVQAAARGGGDSVSISIDARGSTAEGANTFRRSLPQVASMMSEQLARAKSRNG